MLIRFFRIAILFFLLAAPGFAATYTSTQDGNWNTDATWGGGGHPTSNDDIAVIGHKVTYDAGVSAVTWGNVTINSGGMLVFPSNANSTLLFNTTGLLTINNGGEIRTGTTSAVDVVNANYTCRLQWPSGSTARYALVANGGSGKLKLSGDPNYYGNARYAYLKSDWTSGQTFYVGGDFSSKWRIGQKIWIHRNTLYSDYKTDSKFFTIAAVGAYDSGNDRTPITILEAAPGVTFNKINSGGYQTPIVMCSRNVELSNTDVTWSIYDNYTALSENIRLDNNNSTLDKIVLSNVAMYGWDRCFENGYKAALTDCIFAHNNTVCYNSYSYQINSDFINNSYGFDGGNSIKVTGLLGANTRGLSSSTNFDIDCTFVGNSYGITYGPVNRIRGSFLSCGVAIESITGGACSSSVFLNNSTALRVLRRVFITNCLFSDNTTFISQIDSSSASAIFEKCLVNGVESGFRNYSNTGDILPLVIGDTDWIAPPSNNNWISRAIPGSLCDGAPIGGELIFSPVNEIAAYAPASTITLTFQIYPVGWTTSLDQDDVVLEVKYLDSASGITRTTAYNTSQTYANGAWRSCSVTFTPSQAGVVYFQLYFRSYESGGYVLIDPIWKVE